MWDKREDVRETLKKVVQSLYGRNSAGDHMFLNSFLIKKEVLQLLEQYKTALQNNGDSKEILKQLKPHILSAEGNL